MNDDKETELIELAVNEGPQQEASLRRLSDIGCFGITEQQEIVFRRLILEVVDGESQSEYWYEALVPYAANKEFIDTLKERAESAVADVRRRAKVALVAIELSGVDY